MTNWKFAEVKSIVQRVHPSTTARASFLVYGEQTNWLNTLKESDVHQFIANLGKEGWELVSHSREDKYDDKIEYWIFKRPMEEENGDK